MDLLIRIIIIFCAGGIFFVLPSTIYTFMFLGIFYKTKPLLLDSDDPTGTHYYAHREELKKVITEAKQIPCQEVWIKSDDGLNLFGRYYDQGSTTTVVLVHGYQSNSYNNFSSLLKYFLSLQYNVCMIDQRAHGLSGGHFTTCGAKEQYDVLNWISWLEENTASEHVFLYGISMGATTVGLASDKIRSVKVKGLMMEAGFTSFYDELVWCMEHVFTKKAALNYILLCIDFFLKADIKESTLQTLAKTKIPVLFLYGDKDKDVPTDHTRQNYLACASEKELCVVEGAGHTMCHMIGKESVEKKLRDFIAKYNIK